MTSKFTREELLNIIETDHVQCGEASALARMALAAMDSEPVVYASEETLAYAAHGELLVKVLSQPAGDAIIPLYRHAQPAKGLDLAGWQFKSVNGDWLGLIDEHGKNQAVREGCEVREVFAMADGVNDRDQVRREHAEWSQTTFGNVGPIGPLKHLSKEALEAAAEPGDLSEWADMQFLLWDAQRRAGITDEQITKAMIEKLAVNKQREWPEPKDGEPRLHIKQQPEPVVPEGLNPETTDLVLRFASALADKLYKAEQKYGRSTDWMKDDWYDDCLQSLWEHIEKGDPRDVAAYCAFMWYHGWVTTDYDRNVQNACRAAMLQAGNSPVIPDGLIAAVNRLLDSDGSRGCYSAIQCGDAHDEIERLLAAAPQEVKGEHQIRDEMDMGARITSHRFKV